MKTENNYILKLRTMTMKSVFDGGQLEGLSVAQALGLGRIKLLRYIYFHYERISFTEDILEILDIPLEFRISKPCKCLETYEKYLSYLKEKAKSYFESLTEEERLVSYVNKIRKGKKALKNDTIRKNCATKITKKDLQNVNHGKSFFKY